MENNLLVGYFGYQDNQIDGQTVKTRLIGDILLSIGGSSYDFFDTQLIKTNPINSIIKIIIKVLRSKSIVIMPGENGLIILFPLIYIISLLSNKNIHYVVVGGWLPLFLKNHKYIKSMLKTISGIYVESQNMNDRLKKMDVDNVKVFYNFRKIDHNINDCDFNFAENMKIVFYSRVKKSKGVLDLLDAFSLINNKSLFLDIYGPIDSEFKEEFFKKIKKDNSVKYKGILINNTYSILSQYRFMVFPTYYEGEGCAGAIIDAYISGLPVIASDWKYNSEFVKDNVTGLLYKTRSIQDLRNKIELLIENVDLYNSLKENALIEANLYNFNSARNFVKQNILC